MKFHGRERDAQKISQIIRENDVVVLSGASGVGKTSALYQAIRPELERLGWAVMLCDKWSPPRTFEAADLIETQAAGQLPLGIVLGGDQPSLVAQLDEYYPDEAVIVLDQFEELIRYRRGAYQKVLRWIESTAKKSHVRIVISLRVEYEHELTGPGGLKIGPFQMQRCELAPITDPKVIEQIIRAGRTQGGEQAASDGAITRLVKIWEETHSQSEWSEVGLLHLQATLYSLWHGKTTAVIEESQVARLAQDVAEFNEKQTGADEVGLYEYGLSQCVEVALTHCRDACEPAGVDWTLAARARELITDMTGHLSSGGYKISLDRDELADRLIRASKVPESDRAAEQHARTKLAQIVDGAASGSYETDSGTFSFEPLELPDELDWLAIQRSGLLDEDSLDAGIWPWELDPEDSTGGALLGLRPVESAIEELRSLHFALEWLRMCELIRVTSTEPGKVMVSLNHDRFAAGLTRWTRSFEVGSSEAISRVSAIRGAVLNWSGENDEPIPGGVVANVRWADCQITRRFVDVTFVNCDFRGSTLRGCEFDGVSFVNCLLDDVEFLDCTIKGRPGPVPTDLNEEQIREQPSFLVSAPNLVPILHRYRETTDSGGDSTLLYSRTAGVAAVPATKEDVARVTCDPQPQPGGLTMYGGFLSSLKVRACKFPDGGTLSLRHVAGTSVEFAELTEARVEVFAAALRGLTVTLPISKLKDGITVDGATAEAPTSDAFHLELTESRIINAWFGPGLQGSAVFTSCRVWQLFNGSTSFAVTLPDSPLMGAVNIQQADDLIPFAIVKGQRFKQLLVESLEGLEQQVLDASALIDYRRRPAKYELSRRSESGATDAAGRS
ncbi:nSTAND1 domain-containing NTPase [Mycolicibacterium vanbaalenii]|uniref:nSTAND1 domain-containing NTPase n=1 Tax=Mycolicibacterium vanbaalenii TaxID=110539 RepID=UPI00059B5FAF|nr:pentapeptide repeat-containing protein [Mycolicibacterium vanbaalenii]MCV7126964.1 pentapeptide repeat-containing protein [Mycolicibacterium vanbaalenii PYR-1]